MEKKNKKEALLVAFALNFVHLIALILAITVGGYYVWIFAIFNIACCLFWSSMNIIQAFMVGVLYYMFMKSKHADVQVEKMSDSMLKRLYGLVVSKDKMIDLYITIAIAEEIFCLITCIFLDWRWSAGFLWLDLAIYFIVGTITKRVVKKLIKKIETFKASQKKDDKWERITLA